MAAQIFCHFPCLFHRVCVMFLKSFEVSMFIFTEIVCTSWDEQRELATSKSFFFLNVEHQGYIYLIKNTLQTVILWNIITIVIVIVQL